MLGCAMTLSVFWAKLECDCGFLDQQMVSQSQHSAELLVKMEALDCVSSMSLKPQLESKQMLILYTSVV